MNYLNECCNVQLKFYTKISCRLCWECQSCKMQGCDKNMYSVLENNISAGNLINGYLKAYSVTENIGGYEPPDPGANPGRLRGLDCDVVIMKVHEKTRVYMREPVTLNVFCDKKDVPISVKKVELIRGATWACDVGPVSQPLVATLTIDNKNLPLIVTE